MASKKKGGSKSIVYLHESTNKGLALAITGSNNAKHIGRPLQIVNTTRKDLELVLENEIIAGAPDPYHPRSISGGDPLTIWGVAGNCDWVSVLTVDLHFLGVVQAADDHRAAIAVEDRVRFGIAGDQDSAAPLC